MRVASQGETADRITLEMLPLTLLLLLLLSPKITGMSQQLKERLGRRAAGSEGFEDDNGRDGLDF